MTENYFSKFNDLFNKYFKDISYRNVLERDQYSNSPTDILYKLDLGITFKIMVTSTNPTMASLRKIGYSKICTRFSLFYDLNSDSEILFQTVKHDSFGHCSNDFDQMLPFEYDLTNNILDYIDPKFLKG